MATGPLTINRPSDQDSSSLLLNAVTLLGILVVSIIAVSANYWLGLIFFFVAILIWILMGIQRPEIRGPVLAIFGFIFIAVLVGSLVQTILVAALDRGQLAAAGGIVGTLVNSYEATIWTAVIVGFLAPFILVGLPVFVLALLAAILAKDDSVSIWTAAGHLFLSWLGFSLFSLKVEGGEVKGTDQGKHILETFGGKGLLKVYPGQVVVLHRMGRITRVIQPGSTMLKLREQVKAIFPLTPRGKPNKIERVLTQDRISLTIHIFHAAQLEQAEDTDKRLANLKTSGEAKPGQIANLEAITQTAVLSDDFGESYEGTIQTAAMGYDDVWGAHKGRIEGMVRDIIMSYRLDDLFYIGEGLSPNGQNQANPSNGSEISPLAAEKKPNLDNRITLRRIFDIETAILNTLKDSKLDEGIVLKAVDISEVEFPPNIKSKIEEEATTQLDARMKVMHAEAHKSAARFDAEAAQYRASAIQEVARAEAQAEAMREDVKIKSTAEYYRRIIRTLKQEGQSDQTIEKVLQGLAASVSLEDEFKRLMQVMRRYSVSGLVRNLPDGSEEQR